MKLIIGGAYQGKLAYAKKKFQTEDGWADGRTCDMDAVWTCRGMDHFHEYTQRLLEILDGDAGSLSQSTAFSIEPHRYALTPEAMEQWAAQFAAELAKRNPQILVVSNELGCGVVPLDRTDRLWRELTGRICTCLAQQADEVVRVTCGIGLRLK